MKNGIYKKPGKTGSAIAMCLVFAAVLLLLGLSFSKMTQNAKMQTVQIDERIKLDYLANSLTELAILKFQLYPADFYACMEAEKKGNDKYLRAFGVGAPEFTDYFRNNKDSHSTFNDSGLYLSLASMTILTEQKWRNEVLYIEAVANYVDQYGKSIDKDVTRLVEIKRKGLQL